MKRFPQALSLVLSIKGILSSYVHDFTSENLTPPIWLQGTYYTSRLGFFDEYLYIVPQVFIHSDSEFAPTNGSIVQMYA